VGVCVAFAAWAAHAQQNPLPDDAARAVHQQCATATATRFADTVVPVLSRQYELVAHRIRSEHASVGELVQLSPAPPGMGYEPFLKLYRLHGDADILTRYRAADAAERELTARYLPLVMGLRQVLPRLDYTHLQAAVVLEQYQAPLQTVAAEGMALRRAWTQLRYQGGVDHVDSTLLNQVFTGLRSEYNACVAAAIRVADTWAAAPPRGNLNRCRLDTRVGGSLARLLAPSPLFHPECAAEVRRGGLVVPPADPLPSATPDAGDLTLQQRDFAAREALEKQFLTPTQLATLLDRIYRIDGVCQGEAVHRYAELAVPLLDAARQRALVQAEQSVAGPVQRVARQLEQSIVAQEQRLADQREQAQRLEAAGRMATGHMMPSQIVSGLSRQQRQIAGLLDRIDGPALQAAIDSATNQVTLQFSASATQLAAWTSTHGRFPSSPDGHRLLYDTPDGRRALQYPVQRDLERGRERPGRDLTRLADAQLASCWQANAPALGLRSPGGGHCALVNRANRLGQWGFLQLFNSPTLRRCAVDPGALDLAFAMRRPASVDQATADEVLRKARDEVAMLQREQLVAAVRELNELIGRFNALIVEGNSLAVDIHRRVVAVTAAVRHTAPEPAQTLTATIDEVSVAAVEDLAAIEGSWADALGPVLAEHELPQEMTLSAGVGQFEAERRAAEGPRTRAEEMGTPAYVVQRVMETGYAALASAGLGAAATATRITSPVAYGSRRISPSVEAALTGNVQTASNVNDLYTAYASYQRWQMARSFRLPSLMTPDERRSWEAERVYADLARYR
jgi:hypothetical protein